MFWVFVFSVLTITSSLGNDDKISDVKIEITQQASACEKSIVEKDTIIFDYMIFYKNEGETIMGHDYSNGAVTQTLTLGVNQMLPVVENALLGMCIGEERKITVPPEHGYGDKEKELPDGKIIPPNSTIVIVLNLRQIVRQTDQEIENLFHRVDKDGNGVIDENEIILMSQSLGQISANLGKEMTKFLQDQMVTFLKIYDKNEDNLLDFEEFKVMMSATSKITPSQSKEFSGLVQTILNPPPQQRSEL